MLAFPTFYFSVKTENIGRATLKKIAKMHNYILFNVAQSLYVSKKKRMFLFQKVLGLFINNVTFSFVKFSLQNVRYSSRYHFGEKLIILLLNDLLN